MWSFAYSKENQLWLWLAICRRTKQVVSYFIGDRTTDSCFELWKNMPEDYRKCCTVSDLYDSYDLIFGGDPKHKSVPKGSGETNHIERFNNTLRQRLSRFVRKTLSFSKSEYWHKIVTDIFIKNYNLSVTI